MFPETPKEEPKTPGRDGDKYCLATRPPDKDGFRSPWRAWLDAVDVVTVPDLAGWRAVLNEARAVGICGLDTETTGLDPLQAQIRLVQLAVPLYPAGEKRLVVPDGRGPEPGSGAKVRVLDLTALPGQECREALEALAELVADPGVVKVGHNLKFDLAFLRATLGRRLPVERIFDTMLASQLVTAGDFVPESQFAEYCEAHGIRVEKHGNEKTRYFDRHGHEIQFERDTQKAVRPVYPTHSLQQVAHRHLEIWLEKEYQVSDWTAGELSERQIRYAAEDAAVLLPLREILVILLLKNRLVSTAQLEFSCVPAVVEIELCGMFFDAPRARELLAAAIDEAARYRETLVVLAGNAGFRARPKKNAGKKYSPELNPDSGADCADCLKLLAEREGVLAGSGKAFEISGEEMDLDTRDETLSRLASRLPEGSALREFATALRTYRAAKKRADFLKKWLELQHPATDRLHPDLRQINPQGVGRFSASNPNLQQSPRGSDIRSLFRAPEGRKLVVADYEAIEMKLMAELSGDANLVAAFREGADIHRRTAAAISGKPEGEISKEERQAAKACGFGLIYGMASDTLRLYAETSYGVKMTPEEAEASREAFFRAYPGVAAWHARQERKMFEDGFETFWRHDFERGFFKEKRPCIRTLGGRLRVWPVVKQERKKGNGGYLRKAGSKNELFNSPDQGSGADVAKCSLARLYREFLQRGWEDVWLIGCVHDELILETSEEKASLVAELLGSVMELAGAHFVRLVPITVEAAVCRSWAEK
ncbi:hypothetical protein G7K71_13530 [Desulfofundulus sp. TPOSR]|uniref:DNA polymerase n=1 Tax=Desulfofundulus sp. TPOSR TaxID=2714340 RepID=UPI00140E3FBB|nr:DNA polymerase [Desulfofundulus sp. TPOSR]NHM27979.1 hypothetical protein [Desulfofundulus sp. TPOSR]